MDKSKILLVNFDKLVQKSLYELLCRYGYAVDSVNSTEEALSLLSETSFHVVLADINGSQDTVVVKKLKEKTNGAEVVVLASYGSLEAGVASMKIGAFDYLVRPVKDDKILSTIEQALTNTGAEDNKVTEKNKDVWTSKFFNKGNTHYDLIGNAKEVQEIYTIIERIANTKATILIQGESGTGKRVLAHAIHKNDSKRRHKPFIEVSCGALPREIIESELFGHVKGAFTGAINDRKGRFELANGGTILLDDIDTLPMELQVKLLRVLQQKEFERVGDHKTMKVDVRIIATTNQDIQKLVTEKKFREDLFYRINIISIVMQPLRERKEDLPLLADHFVELYARENHKNIKGVAKEVMETLMRYNWPGNIRELENVIERAVILDINNVINNDDLPEVITNHNAISISETSGNITEKFNNHLKEALEEPERVHILRVLKEVGWNKKEAAKKLGVNRTTLYNKLRKYNVLSQVEAK